MLCRRLKLDLNYLILKARQRLVGAYCARRGHGPPDDNYRGEGGKWYRCSRCKRWLPERHPRSTP